MGMDLFVGSDGLEAVDDTLGAELKRRGLAFDPKPLFAVDGEIGAICLLNVSAVSAFLAHAAEVEGLTPEEAHARLASGGLRFPNLPWWLDSIWLPFDFAAVGTTASDSTCFIGSCQGLLRELAALERASPHSLGVTPPGYEAMRRDIEAFYQDSETPSLDEVDTLRWIWRALRDGAELAVSANAALTAA